MSFFSKGIDDSDMWAISGISFASPIIDILDKEVFSLEELLVQEEFLQEVKSHNTKLIDFLKSEPTMKKIVSYLTSSPKEEDDDETKFKYPYVCCELICCQTPSILSAFILGENGRHFKDFLSILDSETTLDNFLAGYFEKIMEHVLRSHTEAVIGYLNENDNEMFYKFLNHADSYSISQLTQRLLLPHISFDASDEENTHTLCSWASSFDVCKALIQKMISDNGGDSTLHINELLVTVIQLSPIAANLMENLCSEPILDMLCNAIKSEPSLDEIEGQMLLPVDVACISVVECLLSRVCESFITTSEECTQQGIALSPIFDVLKESIDRMAIKISSVLAYINTRFESNRNLQLSSILACKHEDPSVAAKPILGTRRLHYVKLLESLLRTGMAEADEEIANNSLLPKIIDLMFEFSNNSVLHSCVQRIILLICEDYERKIVLFRSLISECRIVDRIIGYLTDAQSSTRVHQPLYGHLVGIGQVFAYGLSLSPINDSNVELNPNQLYLQKFRQTVESCIDLSRWESFYESTLVGIINTNMASPNVNYEDVTGSPLEKTAGDMANLDLDIKMEYAVKETPEGGLDDFATGGAIVDTEFHVHHHHLENSHFHSSSASDDMFIDFHHANIHVDSDDEILFEKTENGQVDPFASFSSSNLSSSSSSSVIDDPFASATTDPFA